MFFSILWKLVSKYLPRQSSMFVNIPAGIIEDSATLEASQALNNQGFPIIIMLEFTFSML